ncbi:MAG: NERD domain-containing protein [Gammaproteobacteria bacterium]|nr:NERD domain-containing protein [Gammaproteobacteria bacterium]
MSDIEIIGSGIAGLIAIILFLIWRNSQSGKSYRDFPKIVKRISTHYMRNVMIPDAVEGSSFIDWLILTPRGVLIISQKPYKGLIFASENISHWTQVLDRRSYSFDNPLRQLEVDVVTIKSLIPGIPVKGYVVFDRDSFFPKGKPKIVLTLKEIKQNISVFREGEIKEELLIAWDKLQQTLKEGTEEDRGYGGMNSVSNYS